VEVPEIPEIDIPVFEVYIPEVTPPPILKIAVPGCTYTHRDIGNTGNINLLLDDPRGVTYSAPCGQYPSFIPMNYEPDKLVVIEEAPVESTQPEMPQVPPPETPEVPQKKEEETFKPCPGPNDQRVGDYRNEKKLERVLTHKRNLEGDCETIYEPVAFIEQYLPTPATAVSTGAIALIAASSPLILNIIKPAVKNLFKKLTSKKKKEE
tara:strand:- start:15 stop:638 length:624 start_codon:yes stop_codon:yes gene_type:complete